MLAEDDCVTPLKATTELGAVPPCGMADVAPKAVEKKLLMPLCDVPSDRAEGVTRMRRQPFTILDDIAKRQA